MESNQQNSDTAGFDLVANVNLLANCVPRTAGLSEAPDQVSQEILRRALEAAQQAQEKLAKQEERIADLERIATTDPLTGLLNRRGFEKELRHMLAASRRYDERGILIFVDLDGFKLVNDTYGHAAGDAVLKRVAQILGENIRESDYVARLGGDEFAVLLVRIEDEDGLGRAEALDRVLNGTFVNWKDRMIALRASLGLQSFSGWETIEELLNCADRAMYQAKRHKASPLNNHAHA